METLSKSQHIIDLAKELIDEYADMGQVVGKYGEDAIDLIKRYGGPAVQMMRAVDPQEA